MSAPEHEPMLDDLADLRCGARSRAGTPCQQGFIEMAVLSGMVAVAQGQKPKQVKGDQF